jgi:hypothetical protein
MSNKLIRPTDSEVSEPVSARDRLFLTAGVAACPWMAVHAIDDLIGKSSHHRLPKLFSEIRGAQKSEDGIQKKVITQSEYFDDLSGGLDVLIGTQCSLVINRLLL